MPGKPFQSKLRPHETEVFALRDQGMSFRNLAGELNRKYGLTVTHNAVFSFVKARRAVAKKGHQLFFEGLSGDLRDTLIRQIAAVWTHDSTAIEGNTLTLGETVKILELGLTINGKPLREHQEVYGHARAIELIYRMIRQHTITESDLFNLHRAVMDKAPMDVMNPVGDWKQEFNGTTGVVNGRSIYMDYASPLDVPALMIRWLKEFNRTLNKATTPSRAISLYTRAHMILVRIHPFFDGNGRVARLVANLPVLRGGLPPIVIPSARRSDYIDLLWDYQNAVGPMRRNSRLLPSHPAISRFETLVREAWTQSVILVEEARRRDAERQGRPQGMP